MFIKLTQQGGDPICVNMGLVQSFARNMAGTATALIFGDGEGDFILVMETPEQILIKGPAKPGE